MLSVPEGFIRGCPPASGVWEIMWLSMSGSRWLEPAHLTCWRVEEGRSWYRLGSAPPGDPKEDDETSAVITQPSSICYRAVPS